MEKQRSSKINIAQLISKANAKAQAESEKKSNTDVDTSKATLVKGRSPRSKFKEVLDEKIEVIKNKFAFFNKPIDELNQRTENSNSVAQIIKEYSWIYKDFGVFDDVKPDISVVVKRATLVAGMLLALSGLLLIAVGGLFIPLLLGIISFFVFYVYFLSNNDFNGVNDEKLHRKYKVFFTMMMAMKEHIETKEDLHKLIKVLGTTNDVKMKENDIQFVVDLMWPFLSKTNAIATLNVASETKILTYIEEYFGDLIERRNKLKVDERKEFDKMVELLNHGGIEAMYKVAILDKKED